MQWRFRFWVFIKRQLPFLEKPFKGGIEWPPDEREDANCI